MACPCVRVPIDRIKPKPTLMITRNDTTHALQALHDTLAGRRIVFAAFHGSRLYGTATPDSDLDVRAVFLPTHDEILLGHHDFSIDNNPTKKRLGLGDVDVSAFSFSRFLRLLGKFDVNAVEMLFASIPGIPALIVSNEAMMGEVRAHASRLIAMGGSSPISHARAIVGSMAPDRDAYVEAFETGMNAILEAETTSGSPSTRLFEVPGLLTTLRALPGAKWRAHGQAEQVFLEHQIPADVLEAGRWPYHSLFIQVADRMLATTMSLHEVKAVLSKPLRRLQDQLTARRARAEGVAISPKDLYHAVRILEQHVEVQRTGRLTFPRPNATTLLDIRNGVLVGDALQGVVDDAFAQAMEANTKPMPFAEAADVALRHALIVRAHRDEILRSS